MPASKVARFLMEVIFEDLMDNLWKYRVLLLVMCDVLLMNLRLHHAPYMFLAFRICKPTFFAIMIKHHVFFFSEAVLDPITDDWFPEAECNPPSEKQAMADNMAKIVD